MITYKVYYDYHEGQKVPIWLIINTKENQIDWSQPHLLIPVQTPFDLHSAEDFDPEAMNVTILLDDLLLHTQPNTFGLNLTFIQQRLEEHGVSVMEVDNFIIQVADLEDVLQSTL